jgi:hypothetical protein
MTVKTVYPVDSVGHPIGGEGRHITSLCAFGCRQDGNNINNIMTVLPRDDNGGVRERLLSPTGEGA